MYPRFSSKALLLSVLFIKICFLAGTILDAQENSFSPTEESKSITVEEYTLFLNASALSDPYHLYEAKETSISRLGAVGAFQYTFPAEEAKKPVILLSTLDAIRYNDWKSHQSDRVENPQEIMEEGRDQLRDNKIVSTYHESSLYLKMDCLLKTNLCSFSLLHAEKPRVQPSECAVQTNLIGLALFLLQPEGSGQHNVDQCNHHQVAEVGSPHHGSNRQMNVSVHNTPIAESAARAARSTDSFSVPPQTGYLNSDHDIKEISTGMPARAKLIRHTTWPSSINFSQKRKIGRLIDASTPPIEVLRARESELSISDPIQAAQETASDDTRALVSREQFSDSLQTISKFKKELLEHEATCLAKLNKEKENHTPNKNVIDNYHAAALFFQQAAAACDNDPANPEKTNCLWDVGVSFLEAAQERQKDKPSKKVINYYCKAAYFLKEATKLWDGNPEKTLSLRNSGRAFLNAAQEAQKKEPNTNVINYYCKGAYFFLQAATLASSGKSEKILSLGNLGFALFNIAQEAQKKEPNKNVIYNYHAAALFFEQAAAACDNDPVSPEKINSLWDIGTSFLEAAQEAQKNKPNQEAIDHYHTAAHFFQQAAQLWDCNSEKARGLSNSGVAFLNAAQEAQKNKPNQEAIDHYCISALFFQQAAAAYDSDPVNLEKISYLWDTGTSFLEAAQEAQKNKPNKKVIDNYFKGAYILNEAARLWDDNPDNQLIARCLGNIGCSLFRVGKERQKENPLNKKVIANYLKVVCCLRRAALTWNHNPNNQEKSKYLQDAGLALLIAAEEVQKDKPNQKAIDKYHSASKDFRKAAAAWDDNPDNQVKAKILSIAASSCFRAGKEMQREKLPNQNVIDSYCNATCYLRKAAEIWDKEPDNSEKAEFLSDAGITFLEAAEEMQKPNCDPQLIQELLTKATDLLRKAEHSTSVWVDVIESDSDL